MKFTLLLCCLSLFCYVYVYADETDECSQYTDCLSCIEGANLTVGMLCYFCGGTCETVHFNGIISGDCTITDTHIWSCSYNALFYVIVLLVSSLCVCCICCVLTCFLCLCCIAACSKRRRTTVVQQEMSEQLLGDQRAERRENRKIQTKLVMEKYGKAV